MSVGMTGARRLPSVARGARGDERAMGCGWDAALAASEADEASRAEAAGLWRDGLAAVASEVQGWRRAGWA